MHGWLPEMYVNKYYENEIIAPHFKKQIENMISRPLHKVLSSVLYFTAKNSHTKCLIYMVCNINTTLILNKNSSSKILPKYINMIMPLNYNLAHSFFLPISLSAFSNTNNFSRH